VRASGRFGLCAALLSVLVLAVAACGGQSQDAHEPSGNFKVQVLRASFPGKQKLAKRSTIGFADVLDYDFVGLDRASALQRFLADKAVRIGQPLRLRVQLRSFDAVCRLVECNVGIGIVPETTARRVARTMAIVPVVLTDPWAVRELTICIRSLDELPPYARQLVEHLRTTA